MPIPYPHIVPRFTRALLNGLLAAYATWREYSAEYDRLVTHQRSERQATARHTARV